MPRIPGPRVRDQKQTEAAIDVVQDQDTFLKDYIHTEVLRTCARSLNCFLDTFHALSLFIYI